MSSVKRDPMSQRAGQLLDRIDAATDRLVNKFSEIVALSGNTVSDRGTVAVDSFNIETHSSTIVRATEDLLLVTRNLKESWILGYIRPIEDEGSQNDSEEKDMDRLLDAVVEEDS